MRKPNTHFEQVPLELVKKLAKNDGGRQVSGTDGRFAKIPPRKADRLPSSLKNRKRV
jgi:hypothetical protein